LKKKEYKKELKRLLRKSLLTKIYDDMPHHIIPLLCGGKCACTNEFGLLADLTYINNRLPNKKMKKFAKKLLIDWLEDSAKDIDIDGFITFRQLECLNRKHINKKLLRKLFKDLAKLIIKSGKYIKAKDLSKILDNY
jgi:hypothetical protein